MRKIKLLVITLLITFTSFFLPVKADESYKTDYSFYAENYHIDMDVHKNGEVDVRIKMDMIFNRKMQGIFVVIPTKYENPKFSPFTGH